MAHSIIARFWTTNEANEAQNVFEELFQKKDYSHAQPISCAEFIGKSTWVVDILKHLGAVPSTSEARRLIEAGAVSIDQQKITDFKAMITPVPEMFVKVGKHRFYKIM